MRVLLLTNIADSQRFNAVKEGLTTLVDGTLPVLFPDQVETPYLLGNKYDCIVVYAKGTEPQMIELSDLIGANGSTRVFFVWTDRQPRLTKGFPLLCGSDIKNTLPERIKSLVNIKMLKTYR